MNKHLIVLITTLAIFAGCSSMNPSAAKTNYKPVIELPPVTNLFPIIATDPATGVTVTNGFEEKVTYGFIPNPVYLNSASIGQRIATATGTPIGELVNYGLGIGVAALAWFAKRQTDRKNSEASYAKNIEKDRQQLDNILSAVISGVEKGNNDATKSAIEKASTRAGVGNELHQRVVMERELASLK